MAAILPKKIAIKLNIIKNLQLKLDELLKLVVNFFITSDFIAIFIAKTAENFAAP